MHRGFCVFLGPELVDAVLVHCRASRIAPPGRIERIVGSPRARFEQRFCAQTVEQLGPQCAARLASVALPEQGLLAQLKADPGRIGLGYAVARDRQAGGRSRP